ncbi:hypothetical protein ABT075_46045 [Streptomyces sp. NPDC002677]
MGAGVREGCEVTGGGLGRVVVGDGEGRGGVGRGGVGQGGVG